MRIGGAVRFLVVAAIAAARQRRPATARARST